MRSQCGLTISTSPLSHLFTVSKTSRHCPTKNLLFFCIIIMKNLLQKKQLIDALKYFSDIDFVRMCHQLYMDSNIDIRTCPYYERYNNLQKQSTQKLLKNEPTNTQQFMYHLEIAQYNKQMQLSMISQQLKSQITKDGGHMLLPLISNVFKQNIANEQQSQLVYEIVQNEKDKMHLTDLCKILLQVKIVDEKLVQWIEQRVPQNNKEKKHCIDYLRFWSKLPKKYNPYRIWRDTFQQVLKNKLYLADKLEIVTAAAKIYAAHPQFVSPWSTTTIQHYINEIFSGQMSRYPYFFRLKMYDCLRFIRMTMNIDSILGKDKYRQLGEMHRRGNTPIVTNLHNEIAKCLDQLNVKYEKQALIDGFSVDLFIKDKNTVLQVDGPVHFWRQGSQLIYNRYDEGRKDLWKNHKPPYHFGNIPFYRWKVLNDLQKRVYLRSLINGKSQSEASFIVS